VELIVVGATVVDGAVAKDEATAAEVAADEAGLVASVITMCVEDIAG
jgi:hypothetical protein